MIIIGICDDEKMYRAQIIEICEQYFQIHSYEHKYVEFASGEEALAYQGDKILLLFLDIEMGETSGLDVLDRLRESDLVWRIAFASSHKEQMLDTIDLKTLAFLEKPIAYPGVEKCLNIAIREQERNIVAVFTMLDGKKSIELSDLRYVQAEGHYIRVSGKSQNFVGYDSIKQCEEQLQGTTMIRIHKSYLVNLQYVKRIGAKEVIMSDEGRLPVGRKYGSSFREQYLNFVRSVAIGRNET